MVDKRVTLTVNGASEFFVTPEEALTALRALRDGGDLTHAVVTLGAGVYRTEGLDFSKMQNLTVTGDDAVLTGGLTIPTSGFKAISPSMRERLHGDAKDHVLCVDLTSYGLTREDVGDMHAIGTYSTAVQYHDGTAGDMAAELLIDGRRMPLARYPDRGYLYTAYAVKEGDSYEKGGVARYPSIAGYRKIDAPESDVYRIDGDTARRAAGWKTLRDVWLFGYPCFMWADRSSPVDAIDSDNATMTVRHVSLFGNAKDAPYYFYNVFEELDTPGEWYLDRDTMTLYLYPPRDFDASHVTLSLLHKDLISGKDVSDVTLDRITLTASLRGGISLAGERITVRNCTVSGVAETAIRLDGYDCVVRDSEISHTGRGGVALRGGDRATLLSSRNRVENCHIHDFGETYRTYQPAVNLSGVGAVCAHNEIHGSDHLAITYDGNHHIIEYNEIYDVCRDADDSSAVYAGRDYTTAGNTIRYNYFHDIESDAPGAYRVYGVYCDDNLGETHIIGNVFYRCTAAILLHGGHDIEVCNNLIVGGTKNSVYSIGMSRYGGAATSLAPGGTHWLRLEASPYKTPLWQSVFPHIAEYLTWDNVNEQCYSHYCRVSENIIREHKPITFLYGLDPYEPRLHNRIENNPVVLTYHYEGEEKTELCPDSEQYARMCHGFLPIPFDRIGRGKG